MAFKDEMLRVAHRDVQLFSGGDGPPVVYFHGADVYWPTAAHDRLAAGRRVLIPVHPGFGRSPAREEIETMDDLVFHALDVLDTLRLDRVDMVGLSLGGWLAAELAVRHPGRVGRLVLVDAAGTRVPGLQRPDLFLCPPAKARELLFADPTSELARTVVPDAPPPDRVETALRGREAAARLLWNPHVQYRKLTSRLGRVKAPTLIVWGAEDRLLPLALGEAYHRGIPGSTLVTLGRCGHLPPLEQPERFAEAVLKFLAG